MQGRGAGGEELEGLGAVVGYVYGAEGREGDCAVVGVEVGVVPCWGGCAVGGAVGEVLEVGEVEVWVEVLGVGWWG